MTRDNFHDISEDWDWDAQREDTEWVFRDLRNKKMAKVGQKIDLDIQFVPARPGADADGAVRALLKAGFAAESFEDEEDGEIIVEATAEDAEFTLRTIWFAESKATKIALAYGYAPDGWGFAEIDE